MAEGSGARVCDDCDPQQLGSPQVFRFSEKQITKSADHDQLYIITN